MCIGVNGVERIRKKTIRWWEQLGVSLAKQVVKLLRERERGGICVEEKRRCRRKWIWWMNVERG